MGHICHTWKFGIRFERSGLKEVRTYILDTRKKRKEKKNWKANLKYSSGHSNGGINFWVIEKISLLSTYLWKFDNDGDEFTLTANEAGYFLFFISGDFKNSGDLSREELVFCYFIKN